MCQPKSVKMGMYTPEIAKKNVENDLTRQTPTGQYTV